jgi:uncharacterized protein
VLTPETVVVAGVLFLGAAVRSFFGFGDAAVAMPLLALLSIRMETAVPLVGAAGLAVALVALLGGWHNIDLAALKRLTLSTLVGIPFGVLLVTHGSETLITRSLGVLLLAYGGYSLLGPTLPRIRRGVWALPFGFAAGALGSAYNFNGVPVAVFGTMRRWRPDRFRGTLQAHFIVSSILVVAGQGIGGLWTPQVVQLLAIGLPGVLLAVPLGQALHHRVPPERFARYAYSLIVVLGLLLML